MENKEEIVKEIQENLDRLLGLIHQGVFGFYELKNEKITDDFTSFSFANKLDTIANMLYRMGDDDPEFRLGLYVVVEKLQKKHILLKMYKN